MSTEEVLAWIAGWVASLGALATVDWATIWASLQEYLSEFINLVLVGGYSLVRAMGIVVQDGQQGLKFRFGRVTGLADPGFHPLFPGLMTVRVMPVRARTLDIASQRCVTRDGMVYDIDANVTWQVVDVARAVLEIADVEQGLQDAMAVSIQQVVSGQGGRELAQGERLDQALADALTARVEVWGVAVRSAGFVTITPTDETLRITQLGQMVATRRRAWEAMIEGGADPRRALGLLGTRIKLKSRASARRRMLENRERHRRRLVTMGMDAKLPRTWIDGWSRVRGG